MHKYLQIIKATWAEYMIYRLNFVLWRVRMVMQLVVVYFLWWAILTERQELFGYSQQMILTYILLSSIIRTIVLGTTTMEIGDLINRGNLSNFLVRPLNFFRYYIARDAADKLLNLLFSVGEISILFILLRPSIFIQTNPQVLFLTVCAIILGMILYFNFSLIFGFFGFWSPDVWGPRFLSFVVMEFFAGGLFPLDILPQPLFVLAQSLPFFYFLYFPLKLYLGQLDPITIVRGFLLGVAWASGLWFVARVFWLKGLKIYTAEGK